MTTSCTQHGITFTFDTDYTVGQYVNGDYYAIENSAGGGVTIDSITPNYVSTSGSERNGWEVNPNPGTNGYNQGFDARSTYFDASLVPSLPYAASAGESLVKMISQGDAGEPAPDVEYDDGGRSYTATAAVLTVVAAAPASSAFRPPYAGDTKTTHLVTEVDLSGLPGLTAPASARAIADLIRRFERVQIDHNDSYRSQGIHPSQHMGDYGGDIALYANEAIVGMMLDDGASDIQDLSYAMIQYGIDIYYSIKNAGTQFVSGGGHSQGRKSVAVMASLLLGDSAMQAQLKAWALLDGAGFPGVQKFQEDQQYYWGTLAKAVLFGHPRTGNPDDYWTRLISGTGGRTHGDPYEWIDGGELPGGLYQGTVDPTMVAASLVASQITDFAEVWNHISLSHGFRQRSLGTLTRPDPYELVALMVDIGDTDCLGRFVSRHKGSHLNTGYDSAVVLDLWDDLFSTEHLMPPDISPRTGSFISGVEVTLAGYTRITPSGCSTYWDADDAAGPPVNQIDDFPYIETGLTIRYTTDGTEPTASSTLYSAPFTLTGAGSKTIKAKAFHASYEDSGTNIAILEVSDVPYAVVQSKTATTGTSTAASTLDAVFDSTPTEGNLLVAIGSGRFHAATDGTATISSTGWTDVYAFDPTGTSGSQALSVFSYKVAGSSESDTVTFDRSGSNTQRMTLIVVEISGVDSGDPFDTYAVDITKGEDDEFDTVETGSVTATAGQLAVAAMGGMTGATDPTTLSATTTDYDEDLALDVVTFRALSAFAMKYVSTGGSETATFTAGTAGSIGGMGLTALFNAAPETDPPVFASASIVASGEQMSITLTDASSPLAGSGGFTLNDLDGNSYTLSSQSISGLVITYDVSPTVSQATYTGESENNPYTLDYSSGTGSIADALGNVLATFSDESVSNNSTAISGSEGGSVMMQRVLPRKRRRK